MDRSLLAQLKTNIGVDAIIGLEGPNEPNQAEVHFGYMNWPQDLRSFMTRLYRLKPMRTPPCATSRWWCRGWRRRPGGTGTIVSGNLSAMSDKGNGHVYGTYWSMSQKLDQVLPILDQQRPGSPLWMSEFGWHTATNGPMARDRRGHQGQVSQLVPFWTYRRRPKVEKAFIYQLLDQVDDPGNLDNKAHFGLLDYHLNRKPSFYAVKNMINLLCDTPLVGAARSLDYTLGGNLGDIKSLLLQKNNGAFYLALWLDKQSFRALTGPVRNPPQAITVTLPQAVKRVQVFRPADPETDLRQGQIAVKTVAWQSRLDLQVPDHPLILEIVPANETPPAMPGCRKA